MDLNLRGLATRPAPASRGGFSVLVVCTGNICRSAYAAVHLEQALGARLVDGAVVVRSAGTDVNPAVEMPAPIREAIEAWDADPTDHRIEQLTVEAVEQADIVLTMTARQRAVVARLVPRRSSRVLTLTQLAALCDEASLPVASGGDTPSEAAATLRSATDEVLSRRGLRGGDAPDVSDPWGKTDEVYLECLRQIRVAADAVAGHLVEAVRA